MVLAIINVKNARIILMSVQYVQIPIEMMIECVDVKMDGMI